MFFKDPSGEFPRSAIRSCGSLVCIVTYCNSGFSRSACARAGNSLEFKAMTSPENLFAKYHVTS